MTDSNEGKVTMLDAHTIDRLIQIESGIHYDDPPTDETLPFIVVERKSPILLSAPHGAKSYRKSDDQVWHEEDEYTAGMVLLLSELCDVSAIAMTWKCMDYDANYTKNDDLAYKQAIKRLIDECGIQYVIDLHGAALNSRTLDSDQTIDLGTRQIKAHDDPSIDLIHVEYLEKTLGDVPNGCNPAHFVVKRNKFPASKSGTIASFASKQKVAGTDKLVQAIQIEMKPQVRVADRFTSASLYPSCGPYRAQPESILHMLQSLVNFIEYLKAQKD